MKHAFRLLFRLLLLPLQLRVAAALRRSLLTLSLAASVLAQAQQVPDGGRLLEQLKPPPELPERGAPPLTPETPQAPMREESADATRIRVDKLSIRGATTIPSEELMRWWPMPRARS
jgi:hypothetical protein